MRRFLAFLVAAFTFVWGFPALGQNTSIGFTPAGTAQTLSVTTASSTVQMANVPGSQVILWNIGSNEAFYKIGVSAAAAAATTSDYSLPAGAAIVLNVPQAYFIGAITASSTTTIRVSKGVGVPGLASLPSTVTVGGTVATTVADGANVVEGSTTDAASTVGGAGTLSAKLRLMATQLGTINTTLGTPMQTTGGTVGLVAGSAIIGNVRVDQTTPGTTNGIVQTPTSVSTGATTRASGTAAASNLVLKASAGNLYDLDVVVGATSGYLLLFDATALPSNGAVTPVFCDRVNSDGTAGGAKYAWPMPFSFATGITAGFSTTGCFTLTASATASFFGGYK